MINTDPLPDQDAQFFIVHPDRYARIRMPTKQIGINRQRATTVIDECEAEFRTLGEHHRSRRRILVWRMPENHPMYDDKQAVLLKIPYLLFSDESVEDDDATLLPLIHAVMKDAST